MYVRGCMYPCINMCMCIHGHSMYIWKIINNITVHTGTANVHGIVLFLCFLAPCISFVCVYMRVCVFACPCPCRVCVKRLIKRRVYCSCVFRRQNQGNEKLMIERMDAVGFSFFFGFSAVSPGSFSVNIYIYIFPMDRSSVVVRTRGKQIKGIIIVEN